jgi:hypothetical protein
MNAVARATLERLPIPVEDGQPVLAMVIRRESEWRTAWGLDGCRRPDVFGPIYASARDAARASRFINKSR